MLESNDEELDDLNKQLEKARKENEILTKKKELEELQKKNEELKQPTLVSKPNINAPEPEKKKDQKTDEDLVLKFGEALSRQQPDIISMKELATNQGFTVEQRLNLIDGVGKSSLDYSTKREIQGILRDNINFEKETYAPSEALEVRILKQPLSVAQKYLNQNTNPHLKLTVPVIYALNDGGWKFAETYRSERGFTPLRAM